MHNTEDVRRSIVDELLQHSRPQPEHSVLEDILELCERGEVTEKELSYTSILRAICGKVRLYHKTKWWK
ncbi:hypothetical protein TVAGG3_0094880 [Trichomonas vaginalis G3]|uniref:hypothetical protein n=1 Tax=Trichomonas vaginalis (strain ATCC PRA-98 / G3) TaxID=412133 RepID=UPI0021E610AF|nr:hypothetical protein TVAGG3_0094880 [Trichomonas vaginalis G3]KAI5544066.1 hypothetical protein TVAGG3_0094880 [Trichomonas vaginalis G3]